MRRGVVVLVRCTFSRGGFPSELVFHVAAPESGVLEGGAFREYCFDAEKKPLRAQLTREEEVDGYVVGLFLGNGETDDTSRVYLPDSDVYEIPNISIVKNGELAHVPLRP